MPWVICFFVGLIMGGAAVFALLFNRRQKAQRRAEQLAAESTILSTARTMHKNRVNEFESTYQSRASALESEYGRLRQTLEKETAQFKSRIISYDDLSKENQVIKRDLQNIDVTLHKSQLDHELQARIQKLIDAKINGLCERYLKETVKLVARSLTPNNFGANKEKLLDVVSRCREVGFVIREVDVERYIADLRAEFELVVRAALQREEQARIKAQIREEERLKREIEREKAQAERERLAVQTALDMALADAEHHHSGEIEQLKARLAAAESKQRALSMAQQTRAGNVYVISNIGSFGPNVFKIGMTRRLEPMDRIRELGDASVPFPFDVHMVISCDDSPALENAIHRALHKMRINRVNPRKEYFRTDIETIIRVVREHRGCDVKYVADAEALEYNQSMALSEEDADYIEAVYEAADNDSDAVVED